MTTRGRLCDHEKKLQSSDSSTSQSFGGTAMVIAFKPKIEIQVCHQFEINFRAAKSTV